MIQDPPKEEFFDAVRRHICQILGFDYGFIDYAQGHEILSLVSFSADDSDAEARQFVEKLIDEHNQPVTATNTLLAQKVKQTQSPWQGLVYTGPHKPPALGAAPPGETDSYPYAVVPIAAGPGGGVCLIRIISFDTSREIDAKELATVKVMGEHLCNMPQFTQLVERKVAEQQREMFNAESILIIHSNRLTRRRYSRVLSGSYRTYEADSADKALEILQENLAENRIDLIVLDGEITGTSGYGFCRVLKDSPQWKHIPVILIIGPESSPEARIAGLNAGADDCLPETCLDSELLARSRSSLRHRKTERELAVQLQLLEVYAQKLEQATENLAKEKQTVLSEKKDIARLKRDADILRGQEQLLHRISNTIRRSFNISENLQQMLEDLAGYFSLDSCFVVLPSEDEPQDSVRCEAVKDEHTKLIDEGVDLQILELWKENCTLTQALIVNDVSIDKRVEAFRKTALSRFQIYSLFYIPVTYEQKLLGLLGGYKTESQAAWSMDNDIFLRSVADQVAVGVTNARLYARVQRQATIDGLTQLFNHRTGQEKLAEQLRLAERYQRNISIMMLDVDHFKSINDTYGHPVGDTVLRSVARIVKRDCRDVDLPIRYGGEEFLIVLPEVNQEGAVVVAERIRKNLGAEVIEHENVKLSVTASFGVASFPEDASNQKALLDLADKALYLSKRLGRNQVHTAGDLMFEEMPPKVAEPVEPPTSVPEENELVEKFVMPAISQEASEKEELVPEVVEMVKALASALYSKSEYNKTHHLETARLSELLAKIMGLNQQQIEQIRVAGLLHDVGTLQLPSDLVNKQGFLNDNERDMMNSHPVLGAQMLRPIRALKDICDILENHHERWDGTGYPAGLKGEQIPLPARIVAIVDSYHAMISDRPYRPAMGHEEAVLALRAGAGKQWDPFLIDIFIAVLSSLHNTPQQPKPSIDR
ncbi:MAG TPA: diguanylate cyclase [Planktothrix sp.]|jgi:diguanylate cyclase (GGDEF)-like protein/putative nucleotidyltransferase with HDIG domain